MKTHRYKLEHEDYYTPSGAFHEQVGYMSTKEFESLRACHSYDSDDYTDKIVTIDIQEIPNISLEDGSKFNLER